jgi:DNA repair protein RecO (recombination protein O)
LDWSDTAIVLAARPHGETSAILEVLTRTHGRHLGLVRGGASRRFKPSLQPGNSVHLHWRARLSEHLGSFTCELAAARAGTLMDRRDTLAGLNAFSAMVMAAMPEREAHAPVFAVGEILLDAMMHADFAHWGPLYVRWEAGLLEALGFGLDLSVCAATGTVDDLIYVSPRSGRAVSAAAGVIYKERLFALPGFLRDSRDGNASPADIVAGLNLTGFFLLERVLRQHGRDLPPVRARLGALARRHGANPGAPPPDESD